MIELVALHITSERPAELGLFYRSLLQQEPAWQAAGVTGFMLGAMRLEIAGHAATAGRNPQPERLFFDLLVDDVVAECARCAALGATVMQPPYVFQEGELRLEIATLADPDGNYFQLVAQGGA